MGREKARNYLLSLKSEPFHKLRGSQLEHAIRILTTAKYASRKLNQELSDRYNIGQLETIVYPELLSSSVLSREQKLELMRVYPIFLDSQKESKAKGLTTRTNEAIKEYLLSVVDNDRRREDQWERADSTLNEKSIIAPKPKRRPQKSVVPRQTKSKVVRKKVEKKEKQPRKENPSNPLYSKLMELATDETVRSYTRDGTGVVVRNELGRMSFVPNEERKPYAVRDLILTSVATERVKAEIKRQARKELIAEKGEEIIKLVPVGLEVEKTNEEGEIEIVIGDGEQTATFAEIEAARKKRTNQRAAVRRQAKKHESSFAVLMQNQEIYVEPGYEKLARTSGLDLERAENDVFWCTYKNVLDCKIRINSKLFKYGLVCQPPSGFTSDDDFATLYDLLKQHERMNPKPTLKKEQRKIAEEELAPYRIIVEEKIRDANADYLTRLTEAHASTKLLNVRVPLNTLVGKANDGLDVYPPTPADIVPQKMGFDPVTRDWIKLNLNTAEAKSSGTPARPNQHKVADSLQLTKPVLSPEIEGTTLTRPVEEYDNARVTTDYFVIGNTNKRFEKEHLGFMELRDKGENALYRVRDDQRARRTLASLGCNWVAVGVKDDGHSGSYGRLFVDLKGGVYLCTRQPLSRLEEVHCTLLGKVGCEAIKKGLAKKAVLVFGCERVENGDVEHNKVTVVKDNLDTVRVGPTPVTTLPKSSMLDEWLVKGRQVDSTLNRDRPFERSHFLESPSTEGLTTCASNLLQEIELTNVTINHKEATKCFEYPIRVGLNADSTSALVRYICAKRGNLLWHPSYRPYVQNANCACVSASLVYYFGKFYLSLPERAHDFWTLIKTEQVFSFDAVEHASGEERAFLKTVFGDGALRATEEPAVVSPTTFTCRFETRVDLELSKPVERPVPSVMPSDFDELDRILWKYIRQDAHKQRTLLFDDYLVFRDADKLEYMARRLTEEQYNEMIAIIFDSRYRMTKGIVHERTQEELDEMRKQFEEEDRQKVVRKALVRFTNEFYDESLSSLSPEDSLRYARALMERYTDTKLLLTEKTQRRIRWAELYLQQAGEFTRTAQLADYSRVVPVEVFDPSELDPENEYDAEELAAYQRYIVEGKEDRMTDYWRDHFATPAPLEPEHPNIYNHITNIDDILDYESDDEDVCVRDDSETNLQPLVFRTEERNRPELCFFINTMFPHDIVETGMTADVEGVLKYVGDLMKPFPLPKRVWRHEQQLFDMCRVAAREGKSYHTRLVMENLCRLYVKAKGECKTAEDAGSCVLVKRYIELALEDLLDSNSEVEEWIEDNVTEALGDVDDGEVEELWYEVQWEVGKMPENVSWESWRSREDVFADEDEDIAEFRRWQPDGEEEIDWEVHMGVEWAEETKGWKQWERDMKLEGGDEEDMETKWYREMKRRGIQEAEFLARWKKVGK
jgi:hypothetical protein